MNETIWALSGIGKAGLLILLFGTVLASGSGEPGSRASGFAEVEAGKLYYEVAGEGHPLVLLHSGGMDRRMWDEQFKVFSKDYRVIRYDIRPLGRSDKPAGKWSQVKDLYELLRLLKIEKSHLVGLSLGGAIAIDFALEHPEMVTGMVVASSGPNGFTPSKEFQESFAEIAATAEQKGMGPAVELYLRHPIMVPAAEKQAVQEKIRRMMMDNADAFLNWGTYAGLAEQLRPPALERLREIRVPTLVLVGERDVEDILALADIMEKGMASVEKVIIPGAGHLINMEKPEEFNREVLEFLCGL
jgi:pimeloyl-ACP methyl ester carboxylesterase